MKMILVCGARPNFMKIAPLIKAINKHNAERGQAKIQYTLVHTGQHYDFEMSQIFFQELEIPKPDVYLGTGGGTQGEQTGKILIEIEKVLLREKPDITVVVGDVNSTLAAALASVKLHIPVAHVEAGLRAYDREMPEEINRVLTDNIADYLFTPSRDADENLIKEGISKDRIYFVGNIMVDSLMQSIDSAKQSKILHKLNLVKGNYALVTLHRPSNVDERRNLEDILEALRDISRELPVVFPVHPRTKNNMETFGLTESIKDSRITVTDPLGYIDFLALQMNSNCVITDSGGIQEETTVLGIPCLTFRGNTERPVTITQGTNRLIGTDASRIKDYLPGKPEEYKHPATLPELWDGRTAERVINILGNSGAQL